MPPPMRFDHGDTSRLVAGLFFHYQWKTPGISGGDGVTVKLDLRGEPQPDHLLRIPAELGRESRVDDQGYLTGAPELVAEVARSSRSFDLNQKKTDYERVGVGEYVVIELTPNRIHWLVHRRRHFQILKPGRDGIFRSEVFPGLWLDSEAIFAEDLDRLVHVLDQGLASPEHAAFAANLAAARAKPAT
jgi:hypothetical protein